MMSKSKPEYEPTGRWEAYGEYDSNYERNAPVLVDPNGRVHSRYSADPSCEWIARSYADTYNMNADKSAEFRACPYCENGCSWCGK
ncbi:hypothetical protein EBZ80_26720 [bacterium]|nr:hypothetical protein [bacterium]